MKQTSFKQNSHRRTKKSSPVAKIVLIIIIIALAAGVFFVFNLIKNQPGGSEKGEHVDFPDPIYSVLTGLEIDDEKLNQSPTYCVQIPNGSTDGARPQAGLNEAGIIFEAIAEMGITRFAAIFQNPTVSVIGPVRSLRPYYLDWDTPFDCTVSHAGGSPEALSAIASGGQRNLDMDTGVYAWREDSKGRLWNNLFTSPKLLASFNEKKGYKTSNVKAFARLTPDENSSILAKYRSCSEDSSCDYTAAKRIILNFSTFSASHNVIFEYNSEGNNYLRSHQDGEPHLSFSCPENLNEPHTLTECGSAKQIAPTVVAVMRVQENLASDNYHEQIKTISTGKALIFQNGEIIEGTWEKRSQKDQIVFRDENNEIIKLAPGQLWISAVPQSGSVRWE